MSTHPATSTPCVRTPKKRPTRSFHRLAAALLALTACMLMPACKPATGPDPLDLTTLLAEREANNLEISIDEAKTRFGTSSPSEKERIATNLGTLVVRLHPSYSNGSIHPPMKRNGRIPMTSSIIPQGTIAFLSLKALIGIEDVHDSPDARRVILQIRDKTAEPMAEEPKRFQELFNELEAAIQAGNMEEESK